LVIALCLSGSFPLIQTRRSNSPTIRSPDVLNPDHPTDSVSVIFQSDVVPAPAAPPLIGGSKLNQTPLHRRTVYVPTPSLAIPPAFVGDEEIPPGTVHRPRVIPGGIFRH
jgi:hypothetical protein